MPIVTVTWYAGRDESTKQTLAKLIVAACNSTLGTPPKEVAVIFNDVPKTDWIVGDPNDLTTAQEPKTVL